MDALTSSLLQYLTTGSAAFFSAWFLFGRSRTIRKRRHPHSPKASGEGTLECVHYSVLRKAMLAYAKPTDNAGSVVIAPAPEFEINDTIFQTLEGRLPRAVISDKIGVDLFWCDQVVDQVDKAAAGIPRQLPHDKAILDFMKTECNFFMEHADGSFMDHLQFVYDYGSNYFHGHSPRVLLLHSIMGVATNIFPMDVAKESKLAAMLTEDEMIHIQAFPSVLRCLLNWDLTEELDGLNEAKLAGLNSFTYHRCIDNVTAEMTIDQFWVQLNYQLVHLLDFLPAASWKLHMKDQLFLIFIKLHAFLKRHGKLMVKVDFNMSEASSLTEGKPITVKSMVLGALPNSLHRKLHLKSIRKFSANIGHQLDYGLV
jgi:hypothetical protein